MQHLNDTVYIYVNLQLYVKELHKTNSVEPIDLSFINTSYSDAPPCNTIEDKNVDNEFWSIWIELREETHTSLAKGMEEDELQPQEEEHVHTEMQDPFLTVDVHGKGKSVSHDPFTPSGSTSCSFGGRYKRIKGQWCLD